MQDPTSSEAAEDVTTNTSSLEAEVSRTMAQGDNVQQAVRDLTVKALSAQKHDLQSLKQLMASIMEGVRSGAQQRLEHTAAPTHAVLTSITDALAGLDSALARLAEASKLALEEAAGRAQKFSDEELTRVRSELESVESLFLETVRTSATAAQATVSDILHDFVDHAKRNGTVVGSQVADTLTAFNNHLTSMGQTRLEAGMQLTHAIADLMRQIASGVLGGIAERVKPDDESRTAV